MTELIDQLICIKFCIKLEQPFMETTQMIQKAVAMGNWWWAASSQQHAHSCITSCTEFFDETSNHPCGSASWQSRFGAERLLALPKIKITFEREQILDHQWDSGKYNRATDGDWENYVRSQSAYFEGDWGIIVLCTMFFVSSLINISILHITWMDTFWTHLIFPEVGSLGQKEDPLLIVWNIPILLSTWAAPICIPTNSTKEFSFLHILTSPCCLLIYWW